MAVTITRTQVRQEMLKRVPILGRALTADSVTKAGPSLTHIAEYERQRAGLTSFEGQYIHRYNLADPDRWRLITALNSGATDGVINVDGPSYANGTDTAYERLTLHPDDLNFAIAQGQRRQRVRTNIALARGHDMDMEFPTAVYWGNAAALGGSTNNAVTLSKVTNDVRSGTQSMLYAATGAGNYTRGEILSVQPSRLIYCAVLVRVIAGGCTFKLRDPVNNAYIGSTVTLSSPTGYGDSGGGWVLMYIQAQANSNQYLVQVELAGTDATCGMNIDTCFGPYQAGQTDYRLQSAFNEAYKLRFVRPTEFLYPLPTPNCRDGDSDIFIGDLTTPQDWDAQIFRRDANPNVLHFVANSYNNNAVGWGLPQPGTFMQSNMRPIWLTMEAQVSDFEPLLTEASVTSQPLDECACYSLRWLAETASERDSTNPVWARMLEEYKAWAVIEDQARPPQAMHTPVRLHNVRA